MVGVIQEVLSPEEQLVLSGIRANIDSWASERIRSLLSSDPVRESVGATASMWGVAPLFYHNLRRLELDPTRLAELNDLRLSYLHTSARNSVLFTRLEQILAALRSAGIQVIVLKGAALAETIYPNRSARPMSDIDLMVREPDLRRAREVLLGAGFVSSTELSLEAQTRVSHHLRPLVSPRGGIIVELHWTLVRPDRSFRPDTGGLWERAVEADISGVPVRVLAPEDLVLHMSMQAAEDRFVGTLKCLCDVDHAVERYGNEIDWGSVGERSVRWRGQHGTFMTLYLAREMLATAIPDDVLTALRPKHLDSRMLSWAGRRLLCRSGACRSLGPKFMHLWSAKSLPQGARGLLRMVFPPREVVAEMYGVQAESRRLYYLYLVRLRSEFLRTCRIMMRLLTREPGATQAAEEDKMLMEWLESA